MGLSLTPSGLYRRNWRRSRFYSWDDITRVAPKEGKAITVNYSEQLGHRRLWPEVQQFLGLRDENGPKFVLAGQFYEVSPLALYYTLCFYRLHPEYRVELGTEAALERISAADFPDIDAEVRAHGLVRPELFQR
jgi:hypothetical protein